MNTLKAAWSAGLLVTLVAASAALAGELRVGYFPNLTHAQGLIGSHGTRSGEPWFEARMGEGVVVRWYPFNAGPSAMEAIFAGSIDLAYVGPGPALNAYIRSRGEEIRAVSGACYGGSALVVRPGAGIEGPEDFRGKRIGTPQLGNTQDIEARVWLKERGLRITFSGGDARVLPAANADLLSLFSQGRLDAVWTVEPWVSRLEREAGGVIFLEEPEAVTTLLVASRKAIREKRALVKAFVEAHRELTAWIVAHPEEAQAQARAAFLAETRRELPAELVAAAWPRLQFSTRLELPQFERMAENARTSGLLRQQADLGRLIEEEL
jgi:NitT/TauT family transport system substrate-binding protein